MTAPRASEVITTSLTPERITRFWARVDRTLPGCWPVSRKGNGNGHGYTQINLGGLPVLAHRLAWTLTNGEIPDGVLVLHRCDNTACIKTEPDERYPDGHLFLGTQTDNMHDASSKGRTVSIPFADRRPRRDYSGEGNPNWKGGIGYRWGRVPTTPEQRREIAKRAAAARWARTA